MTSFLRSLALAVPLLTTSALAADQGNFPAERDLTLSSATPIQVVPVVDPLGRAAEVRRLEHLPMTRTNASSALGDTLGDELENLATSAGMSYIGLPDGDLAKTPVTNHIVDTAWGTLKTLALTYNFDLVYAEVTPGHPVWRFTPVHPDELVTRTYVLHHNTHEITQASGESGFGSLGGFGGAQSQSQSTPTGSTGTSSSSSFNTDNPLTKQIEDLLVSGGDSRSRGGYVKWISDSNTFLVNATPRQHHEIEQFLAQVDQDLPEIQLDFTFILATDDPTTTGGVNSTLLNGGLGLSATGLSTNVNLNHVGSTKLPTAVVSASDLSATVQLLQQNNKSVSVLTGSATLLSNREGSIQSVTELPIQQNTLASLGTTNSSSTTTQSGVTTGQITYNPVGDIIKFKAKVLDQDKVQLALNIEVSSVASTQNVGGQSVPVVAMQNYNAEATVDQGMSLGMGGLEATIKSDSLSKVPGLGDIPFFGFLFSTYQHSVSRSHLYLFVTPRVIHGHHGGNFDPSRSLSPVDSLTARVPFRGGPGLPLSAVETCLPGLTKELSTLELGVQGGRGDVHFHLHAELLVNEIDLMAVTVDENRLRGSTDRNLDVRLKTLRARAVAVVKNSNLPEL